MSNASGTAALRTQLDGLSLSKLSASTIGHAAFAWQDETKATNPFPTPVAASQVVGLLRKGKTLSETTQERLVPFFAMLAESPNPAETVTELSQRNGHVPQRAGLGGGKLEEEDITVFHITEKRRPLLQQIVDQYEVAQAETEKRRAQFEEARAEAQILLNMLKAAGVVFERRKKHKRVKEGPAKRKGSHISEESALKVLEDIRGYIADGHAPVLPDVPGSFTRSEIEKALNIHHSKVGAAVGRLREMGHLRAAGVVASGKSNQKATVFALV